MIVILIGLAAAMLWSCHDSWSGLRLRHWLVERPAEWLSRMTAGRFVVVVGLLAFVVVAFLLFEAEGLKLAGSMAVEAAPWFIAFDVATYLEASAVLWLLGSTRLVRTAVATLRLRIAAVAHTASRTWRGWRRAPRRVRRPTSRGRNPDRDGAGWLGTAPAT